MEAKAGGPSLRGSDVVVSFSNFLTSNFTAV